MLLLFHRHLIAMQPVYIVAAIRLIAAGSIKGFWDEIPVQGFCVLDFCKGFLLYTELHSMQASPSIQMTMPYVLIFHMTGFFP